MFYRFQLTCSQLVAMLHLICVLFDLKAQAPSIGQLLLQVVACSSPLSSVSVSFTPELASLTFLSKYPTCFTSTFMGPFQNLPFCSNSYSEYIAT